MSLTQPPPHQEAGLRVFTQACEGEVLRLAAAASQGVEVNAHQQSRAGCLSLTDTEALTASRGRNYRGA